MDRTKISPSPRVTEVPYTRDPGKLLGGKTSNFYALLVIDNQLTILPRPARGKAGLGPQGGK